MNRSWQTQISAFCAGVSLAIASAFIARSFLLPSLPPATEGKELVAPASKHPGPIEYVTHWRLNSDYPEEPEFAGQYEKNIKRIRQIVAADAKAALGAAIQKELDRLGCLNVLEPITSSETSLASRPSNIKAERYALDAPKSYADLVALQAQPDGSCSMLHSNPPKRKGTQLHAGSADATIVILPAYELTDRGPSPLHFAPRIQPISRHAARLATDDGKHADRELRSIHSMSGVHPTASMLETSSIVANQETTAKQPDASSSLGRDAPNISRKPNGRRRPNERARSGPNRQTSSRRPRNLFIELGSNAP